jgi:hypothetical protein
MDLKDAALAISMHQMFGPEFQFDQLS